MVQSSGVLWGGTFPFPSAWWMRTLALRVGHTCPRHLARWGSPMVNFVIAIEQPQ